MVENSCFKDLCIRICPEVSCCNSVIEEEQSAELLGGPVEPSLASTWTVLSEDLHGLSSSGDVGTTCIVPDVFQATKLIGKNEVGSLGPSHDIIAQNESPSNLNHADEQHPSQSLGENASSDGSGHLSFLLVDDL